MIIADVTITVSGETSKANSDIVLYRGDYNVEVSFTLNQTFYRYRSLNNENLIEKTTASFAQMLIKLPSGEKAIITDMAPTKDGKAVLTILKEYIDELPEVGEYAYQIRLYDENKEARFTIPPVEKGLKIKEPITHEAEVGGDPDGVIQPDTGAIQPTFDEDGNYNKTEWKTNEYLTPEKLNKIEDAIDKINIRELEEKNNTDEHQAEQDDRLTNLENRIAENDVYNGTQDNRITNLEIRADESELRITNLETRATNLETDSERKEVLIQALLNEKTDKVVTVEAHGNEKHLDYAVDDWLVKLNKIEGRTLVNVCDQKDPIAITKSYTVEGTNHVPLQGEYDGKARPVVYGNTLVNRAHGVQDITVLPKMELQGNNEYNIDGVDGAKVEVFNIKGKTLVNLVNCNKFHVEGTGTWKAEAVHAIYIKPNTTYTMISRVDEITNDANFPGQIEVRAIVSDSVREAFAFGSTTGQLRTFTTPSEIDRLQIKLVANNGNGTTCSADFTVMLFEGDLTQTPELIPNEYVEGLKSSFEDGYIPENVVTKLGIIPDISQGEGITISDDNYTFSSAYSGVTFSHSNFSKPHTFVVIPNNNSETQLYTVHSITGVNNNVQVYQGVRGFNTFLFNQPASTYRMYTEELANPTPSFRVLILEGDYTHLSEEDFNNLGQYKAEVKTVSKNKFDGVTSPRYDGILEYEVDSTGLLTAKNKNEDDRAWSYDNCQYYLRLSKGTYTATLETVVPCTSMHGQLRAYSPQTAVVFGFPIEAVSNVGTYSISFTLSKDLEIGIEGKFFDGAFRLQIEEGSTATEYELFKEYTKTFYLNSPLLEGDELLYKDGQLCHYHKMAQTIIDSSNASAIWEDTVQSAIGTNTIMFASQPSHITNIVDDAKLISNNMATNVNVYDNDVVEGIYRSGNAFRYRIKRSRLSTPNPNGFRQWLSENPLTLVYELATPWYEPLGGYGKIVLDGSEDWEASGLNATALTNTMAFLYSFPADKACLKGSCFCDKFIPRLDNADDEHIYTTYVDGASTPSDGTVLAVFINKSKLTSQDVNGFKQWIQENPVTVIYELANKNTVKEPIAINVFNNSTLTINSNVPVESTVTNYSHRLTAFSEPYTLNYNADGEVTHEIVDDRLTLYGEGVKVNDVILVDGENTPTGDYFEGLKNSFEDGLLPENLIQERSINIGDTGALVKIVINNILESNKTYTLSYTIEDTTTCTNGVIFRLYDHLGEYISIQGSSNIASLQGYQLSTFTTTNNKPDYFEFWNRGGGSINISNIAILEGDWTHLSEEDFNHLGQYKVEYKVTGKNKSPKAWRRGMLDNDIPDHSNWNSAYNTAYIKVTPNTKYIYSNINYDELETMKTMFLDINKKYIGVSWSLYPTTPSNCRYVRLGLVRKPSAGSTDSEFISYINETIQFEEGTVTTQYEPYKEQIKTFYLNSPLLEGDTIEEVNGVATHVHRYGKVVLDGSEAWVLDYNLDSYIIFYARNISNSKPGASSISDRFVYGNSIDANTSEEFHCITPYEAKISCICISKSRLTTPDINGFKQWLQANPTTIVYQLAEPWYEPIGAYGKVVLDGSENWSMYPLSDDYPNVIGFYYSLGYYITPEGILGNCDRFTRLTEDIQGRLNTDNEGFLVKGSNTNDDFIKIVINKSRLSTLDVNGFKQWLRENPTTVIYELLEPQYQDSILCDSYVNGHLDFDSAVPIEKVRFTEPCFTLKYLQPNTKYSIQFDSDNVGKMDAYYWFTQRISNINVVKGKNKFIYSTLDTIEQPKLYFDGIGFNASNIQVVQADEDIEFDYFEGLQSSFEDGYIPTSLIPPKDFTINSNGTGTGYISAGIIVIPPIEHISIVASYEGDYSGVVNLGGGFYQERILKKGTHIYTTSKLPNVSTNTMEIAVYSQNTSVVESCNVTIHAILEGDYTHLSEEDFNNLGKYKVEYKVTGKNKFDKTKSLYNYSIDIANGLPTPWLGDQSIVYIATDLIKVSPNISYSIKADSQCVIYYYDNNQRYITREVVLGGEVTTMQNVSFTIPSDMEYIRIRFVLSENTTLDTFQIEEGSTVTSYEPYQESTKTFYLNSPLLQGDTIEEVNGKLCHVHRMNKIVLDGSEGDSSNGKGRWYMYGENSDNIRQIKFDIEDKKIGYNTSISDKFLNTKNSNPYINGKRKAFTYTDHKDLNAIYFNYGTSSTTINEWFLWLSENPVTLVYELAEPYAEPIEPEQGQLLLTSAKEGDLSTETAVPIKNMSISYTTCVPSDIRIETELLETQTIQNEQDALLVDLAVQQALMNLMM